MKWKPSQFYRLNFDPPREDDVRAGVAAACGAELNGEHLLENDALGPGNSLSLCVCYLQPSLLRGGGCVGRQFGGSNTAGPVPDLLTDTRHYLTAATGVTSAHYVTCHCMP